MNKTRRALLVAVAALLLVVMSVGGTIAWLTAATTPIVNTFTGSDVSVSIEETTTNYQIVPAVDIAKDPKVTASANVPCYVFVKIDRTNWPADLSWNVNDAWTQVPGTTDVYYIVGTPDEETGIYTLTGQEVIAGNTIEVPDTLTKETIAGYFKNAEGEAQDVKLSFTAYIIQSQGFDSVEAAWAEVSN